jgi:hypothetical protein
MLGLLKRGQGLLAHRHPSAGGYGKLAITVCVLSQPQDSCGELAAHCWGVGGLNLYDW